jgi:hypothetical protein
MKRVCCALGLLVLMAVPVGVVAQSENHSSGEKAPHGAMQESADKASPSDAQKAFDQLKTLAGSWAGQLTTFPKEPSVDGKFAQFSLRVMSRGNAMVHELSVSGISDHPLTMFYVDGDRLTLTHYCDAGNRPRMAGKVSPDGKTLEFDFIDLSGGNQKGHMHHAVFTFMDGNHHTEDWTYAMPDGNSVRAHFDLQRTNFGNGSSGK